MFFVGLFVGIIAGIAGTLYWTFRSMGRID